MMTIKLLRHTTGRSYLRFGLAVAAALLLAGRGSGRLDVMAQSNPITVENAQTGDPGWDIGGNAGDPTIQGFATNISVNQGETVIFKINTPSSNYKLDIYRLGYYGGAGARKITTVLPSAALPQTQPACLITSGTGLVDCGNWAASASWASTGAVSGIYVAKLVRNDTGGASHIVFVVREDGRKADVIVQTSDTTWQAYNRYGGASLYCAPLGTGASNDGTAYAAVCPNRATKVSYNRPFDTRNFDARSFLFSAEYPMVRWLEANGYNVKYWAGVDTDRRGADLVNPTLKPSAFLSIGHDEYWSGDQRTRVEAARAAGVNLGFFSGNEMFWKTRYEPSIDGSATPYRTLVTYKETLAAAKIDPALDGAGHPIWTGSWRDPRFSPPADGNRPENGVTGTSWTVDTGTAAITVPDTMKNLRVWQNTRVAALAAGGVATLADGSLGYEWDEDLDNGARPAGIVHLSSTTRNGVVKMIDYGATIGTGSATHNLTLYRHASGALIFGAGTVQWAWGLDATHDGGASTPDQAMQQATITLLADMGAQPAMLQIGADPSRPLIATVRSADIIAPIASLTSPAASAQVQSGNPVTITGTASDTNGVVAGVEVSVDDGATWHTAQGTTSWNFSWVPGGLGTATLRSRAIDDSGNLGAASSGVTVLIIAGNCPCTSLWKPNVVPLNPSNTDPGAVELGIKFTSDIDGFVTGIRFYKGGTNVGTHIGNLWTISGTRLATATFTNETTSGWQQVNFSAPVAITKNTAYVASYHTNVGGYASDNAYFTNAGVDSPPLHALAANPSGGNGVFGYGSSAFPSNTFNATNYYVDLVFAETVIDSSPLVISNINASAIDGSTAVITWKTTKPADSSIDYSIDPGFPSALTFTKSNAAFVTQHSLTLTGLTPNTTYYLVVSSVDQDGNFAMSTAPSFTVPGPTLHDTASVDFLAGTPDANTYIAETGDGEVILKPLFGSEFSGSALPSGWIEVPFGTFGYSVVAEGVLLVDGARVASCVTDGNGICVPETPEATPSAIYSAPHALEFAASFSGDKFQHAGLAQTLFSALEPWAVFSTSNVGMLFARTNPGGGATIVETPLPISLLGHLHQFRIDWQATKVDYYVDNALVGSHALTVPLFPLRPVAASDFNIAGGSVLVDWMRMSPYAATATFQSRVFDAMSTVTWNTVYWKSVTPAGTSAAISVRTGNTATPDGTWTAFVPIAAPGPITAQGRYVQYRAVLATADVSRTPSLEDVIVTTARPPVAVNDAKAINVDTSFTFPASGPGSLKANDTDADTPLAQLRLISVTAPAHGVAILNLDGSVTYTPVAAFTGADTFTYTISDGLLTATATVSMEVGSGTGVNSNPVANADAATVAEDSAATAINVLANDNSGPDLGETLSVTAVTQPAHGAATFTAIGVSYTPAANYNGPDSFTYTVGDGRGGAATATVTVNVTSVNDNPVANADSTTVLEDSAATAIGVLANDNIGPDTLETLVVSAVTQAAHGAVTFTPTNVSYKPAANYNGPDSFTYTIGDGHGGTATATVSVAVTAVNDAPSFTKGANQVQFVNAGAKTVANWATAISAGPADEAGQTLTFITTNSNNALFLVQPAVSNTGTLTYTAAANATGTATVTVTLQDNGGTANGGSNASAAQTFTITVNVVTVTSTVTAVTSSNNPSLFGVPITLTATVTAVPAGAGVPSGSVTFKFGTTVIGSAALAAGVAKLTTSTLPVGTQSITAAYTGSSPASTSAAISQVISPSGTVKVNFTVLAMLDDTKKPKVATIPAPDAVVKVFSTANSCVGNIFSAINPKKWGLIFDGADGPGGVDGCTPIAVGAYQATGVTDANGNATIIVPPLSLNWTTQYLVIARATNFDYIKTKNTDTDPLYSTYPILAVAANQTASVPLSMIATFNGKIVPGKQTEFFGSYLNLVQPEYMEWTEEQEQYPFVMVAQGGWDISTNIAPPSGFVADTTSASTTVADQTTAVQFTLTDVGSDWTETGVTHVINHLGVTKVHTSKIEMFNRRPTKAKKDFWSVMANSAANEIPVLNNDIVAPPKTLAVTDVVQPANGSVTFTANSVSYTPAADFTGLDTFNYSITDSEGVTSDASITVRVGIKPTIFVSDATVVEGNKGTITPALFTVTLSGALEIPVTFDYSTADGAAYAGTEGAQDADYVAASGTLVFQPGETSKTIVVQVIGDNVHENTETFSVNLTNVINAGVSWGTGAGAIVDDDNPPVVSASPVSIVEGNSGTVNAGVTVTVTGDFWDPITVDYLTVDGTATTPGDYTAVWGKLTFTAGTTSQTVTIPIVSDTVDEPNETFTLRLSNATKATLGTSLATVTIINDDGSNKVFTYAQDFNGTVDAGAYVSSTADGEIILKPTVGSEFSGPSLQSGWKVVAVAPLGSTVSVENGYAIVDGAWLQGGANALYGPGRSLEFVAIFSGAADQTIGFAVNGALQPPYAVFTTKADGGMYASSIASASVGMETLLAGNWFAAPHRFRIDWNASTVDYWIDGNLVATHAVSYTGTMRPAIRDQTIDDGYISVDWMRMTPNAAAGTYTSKVVNMGVKVSWQTAYWTADVPAGTAVAVSYRTGSTNTPDDGTWTAFTTIPNGGALAGLSRYLQFKVEETTAGPGLTPAVRDITFAYKQ